MEDPRASGPFESASGSSTQSDDDLAEIVNISPDDDAEDLSDQTWRLLIYRVPSEPSRLRAAVWRRLKNLGAIYLQSAVAALPSSAANDRALRGLRNQIVDEMGGTAILFSAEPLAGGLDVRTLFNEARNDEYEEILDKCEHFLTEVEKEVAIEHFTFGELEENEEDLVKLQRWFAKVQDRDSLGADGMRAAREALVSCAQALDAFAERVYLFDSDQRKR
jgi:hypothetical protein